jgi:hypothetical protein
MVQADIEPTRVLDGAKPSTTCATHNFQGGGSSSNSQLVMTKRGGGLGRRQLLTTIDNTVVLNSCEGQLMLLELQNKRILMAASRED